MSAEVSTRPARRPEIEAVDVDGELVLWDPVGRMVHRLDPVGSLLWPFLDGTASVAELAEDASEVWGVSSSQARVAIEALVEQLAKARLLTAEDESPAAEPARPTYLIDPPSP